MKLGALLPAHGHASTLLEYPTGRGDLHTSYNIISNCSHVLLVVHTRATYAKVDVLNDEKDTRNNGGGMTPDRMEKKYSSTNCQHIGYAEHINMFHFSDNQPAHTLNAGRIYLDEDLSPKVGRLVIQDDDTGDNFRLTAKDAIVSHNIDNVEKVVKLQKTSQRSSKWKNYTRDKLWKQALLARRALFEELPVDSSNETNGLQVQKVEEKIKKLDEEHEALVRIDSDELKPTI
ncbi:hypothetical protein Tco_0515317 [Tanacetum coccineum]